jgi:hypothetical protein
VKTFNYFDKLHPGYHALHVLPGYGHLDPFIGVRAGTETIPLMLAELGA